MNKIVYFQIVLKMGSLQKYAAVFYRNMNITERSTRFIEDEKVPRDATVVDFTWKYVNKNGGPDKRFNGNHQIPICNYYEYHLECDNGINEIIVTSRQNGMYKFSNFINEVGNFQNKYKEIANRH